MTAGGGIVTEMNSRPTASANEDVARLRRWEDAGAVWRVVARGTADVEIALLTCDAGEVVDRFRSADPALLAYVDSPAPGAGNRDRDANGRARNARPRDALGRPLAPGSAGVPTTPEDISLTETQALTEAQRLLDAGRPFHAHEVLEAAWKAAPATERELWRGLAQLAVGLTHAARGNAVGAPRLLRRAADRIEPYAASAPHGVAVGPLAEWARRLATRIEGAGLDEIPGPDLVPRLVL